MSHFIGGQRQRRPATHLLTIRQGKEESLRDYVGRFNKEILEVDEADDKVAMTAFMSGLRSPRLMASLVKKPPTDMAELMFRAQKHINVEDAMRARKNIDGAENTKADRKRPIGSDNTRDGGNFKSRRFENRSDRGPRRFDDKQHFTPLNTKLENVLYEVQNDPTLRWPEKLKTPADKRSRMKYCRFHRDHGHDTNDCYDLKRQVEELIHRGRLNRFVAGREPYRRTEHRNPDQHSPRRSPDRERRNQDQLARLGLSLGASPREVNPQRQERSMPGTLGERGKLWRPIDRPTDQKSKSSDHTHNFHRRRSA